MDLYGRAFIILQEESMKTWILVADAARAFIYESEYPHHGDYQLVHRFHHDESRAKGEELLADRPGHFQTDHGARSSYEKSHPKEVEAEKFMTELAHYVIHAKKEKQFEDMITVVPAHLYGIFEKHVKDHVKITQHFSKDYTQEPLEHLKTLLRIS